MSSRAWRLLLAAESRDLAFASNCNLQSSISCYNPQVIPIKDTAAGVVFAVKLHPRAKRDAITGELGDALKLSLTAPPVEGKANDACIEFFAHLLKLPRSSITIAAGQSSRNKVIRVTGLSAAEVEARLRRAVAANV